MDKKTRAWLVRLPWWLCVIIRELPESGEAYLCDMLLPYLAGMLSLVVPLVVLLAVPEVRPVWYMPVGLGALTYLFVGAITHFCWTGKGHSPWQERGPW